MGPIATAVSKKHTLNGHHDVVWYSWMPYGEYMSHRANHINERLAYQHIAERIRVSELDQKSLNPLYPNATEVRHILLGFLGLDD
jgi:hypothetical protein